ncbi:hypothetical protein J6590_057961 [Homalodisca vitripennis]|nr:hypothetical protein J6590_057961 [Homalodisca vitripennis]
MTKVFRPTFTTAPLLIKGLITMNALKGSRRSTTAVLLIDHIQGVSKSLVITLCNELVIML